MSVQRFYPTKDAFIVSGELDSINTGLDEILELGTVDGGYVARILLGFDWSQIKPVNLEKVLLHLTVSTISNLTRNTAIHFYNQSSDWDEGTGHIYDVPNPKDGASWLKPKQDEDVYWNGAVSGSPIKSISVTSTDLEELVVDITDIYEDLKTIVMVLSSEDMNTRISYFSSNTHTIYRPYIEIQYNDSVLSEDRPEVVDDTDIACSVKNLKEEYYCGDLVRLEIGVRPKYPVRVFSTSSLYLDKNTLPEESYWSIKDEYTGRFVVESSVGTKLSADKEGNYIMLNTELLEPERYYRLLIHTSLKGQELTVDNKNIFKVKRNVGY